MDTALTPAVLHALAEIRVALRNATACQAAPLYVVLMSMALEAYVRANAVTVPESVTGQSGEVSHGNGGNGRAAGSLHDRWISPHECADRLGISERTLRRRWRCAPYSGFCVPQPCRGFKVSEVGLDEHMRRERDRARR